MAKIGRPRMFESPEEFEALALEYFENCKENKRRVSWTGLCLAVGASSRESLVPYQNGTYGKEFSDSVKKALLVVENYYEENMDDAKGIFCLKNFGWTDKNTHEIAGVKDQPLKWEVEIIKD